MNAAKIQKNNLCIGCGLCSFAQDKKIKFQVFDGKFYSPDAGNLAHAPDFCPGAYVNINLTARNNSEHLWGRIESVGKTYSLNQETRKKGSSGGTITEIVTSLLASKAVDRAYLLKSATDNPFIFTAGVADNHEEIITYAGSKYTLSPTLNNFDQVLNSPRDLKWVVVAKPCEISAARNLIQSSDTLDINNFVLVSFFCAGLPSLKANEKLSCQLGVEPRNVKHIVYRGNGCPGQTTITDNHDNQFSTDYHSAWGLTLGKDIHHRCKICPDGIGLDADIVCCDVWDVNEKGYPSFEENDGYSLAIARTIKGKTIMDYLSVNKKIHWEPYDITNLSKVQPAQFYRRTTLPYRITALSLLGKASPTIVGASINKTKKAATMTKKITSFFGTIKRQCSK